MNFTCDKTTNAKIQVSKAYMSSSLGLHVAELGNLKTR